VSGKPMTEPELAELEELLAGIAAHDEARTDPGELGAGSVRNVTDTGRAA
jgi:hypothetical protein